jgi:hypothetical protein
MSKNKREKFKEQMLDKKNVKSIFLSEALFFMESIDIEKNFNIIVEKRNMYMEVYFRTSKEWKKLEDYNNKMEFYPPWICFPGVLDVSMVYREGIGKEYLVFWLKWFVQYKMDERIQYLYLYDIGTHWLEALSFHDLNITVEEYKKFLKKNNELKSTYK